MRNQHRHKLCGGFSDPEYLRWKLVDHKEVRFRTTEYTPRGRNYCKVAMKLTYSLKERMEQKYGFILLTTEYLHRLKEADTL